MIFILNLLSQKTQINAFITTYIQNKYFFSFIKKQTSEVQTSLQRYLTALCGKGKPSYERFEPFDNLETQIFNDTIKRQLIKIFFGIERCILKWCLASKTQPPFHGLLFQNQPFSTNKNLSHNIIKLRNKKNKNKK